MKGQRVLSLAGLGFAVCIFLGGVGVGAAFWDIHRSVRAFSELAQAAYPHPNDDVAALIDCMQSEAQPLADRNHAVWALGRLCDSRALPALESAYTGAPCDHAKYLCQYELEKAIKRCGGTPTAP